MSTSANAIVHQTTQTATSTASSAWSRGPPPAANSKSSSAIQTPSSAGTPQPQAEGGKLESNESTAAPVAIGGHSRKGSLMVGGGADVGRGSLKFGTMDSESNLLSSSPAAPSVTGAHLSSDDVKTFGSIDANSNTDPNAVKAPRRTLNGPINGGKPLDPHALFGARPRLNGSPSQTGQPGQQSHDRRQSIGGFQPPNGMPPTAHPTHLRPPHQGPIPGQPRSPVLSPPVPGQYPSGPQMQQGFRPPQHMPNSSAFVRPNGPSPAMQPGMQRGMGAYGLHPGPQGPYPVMGYPQQGYYDQYNMYGAPQYSIPQWAPQQHPQNQQQFSMPVSPRGNPAQLNASPSPAPPSVNLPGSVAASPVPTPPSRPSSHMGHHPSASNVSVSSIPSTPVRPQIPPSSAFSPSAGAQSSYGLSGSASSFTPRTSKPIKFTRPDGSSVDIKKEAAAAKGQSASQPSAAATPEPKEEPKKNVPSMPVVVRMESEAQRLERLREEAQEARIKEIEAKEEMERKERKARQAREQAEKEKEAAAKEAAEKEAAEKEAAEQQRQQKEREQREAEEKTKAEEERLAAEVRKEDERKKAEEKAVTEAAAKKAEDERAATEAQANAEQKKVQINEPAVAEGSTKSASTPLASAPVSPLSSPALAGAGLPPKPVAAAGLPRRPAPAALEISTPPPESPVKASALSTARPIDDLKSIVYPGSLKSPLPELNADALPGKWRYDRDFLMQFMTVCSEKPENLPTMEEIGLEDAASSGFGTRGGRGGRSSTGTGKGAPPAGLGIGNLGNRPSFPQGMGSFRMGEFGSLRGSTSEDRYNRSLAQNRQGGMARTPSQGGVHGLPSMSLSTSRSGANRSRGGVKRAPQSTQLDPDMAPLTVSSTSWVRSRPTGDDEGTPAFIERKVKSLLNKLTAEKFDSISLQILEWANKSANETDGMTLKLVIKQIFEKATDEAHWSSMYAKLCRMLLLRLDPAITEVVDGKPVSGGLLFRKYLVGRCQADFEAGWKAREEASSAALAKREEDREKQEKNKEEGGETAMLSDEYYAEQKAKRRGLGLVQLIGELYKLDMIGKGVIRSCFARLLANVETPDEEDLESTCKLLTTVGEQYDRASPENMEIVFDRLNTVLEGDKVISRIRFMIMDVIELRRKGWASKKAQGGVMTIAEVHQQAAREQAEKSAAAAQASRESISRGGSRAGSRRDAAQPGEWQSVGAAAAGRPISRPADFSQLGRGVSSAGSAAPNFGPKSVFNKAKGKASGSVTPPLSRQASTSNMNMFSALDEPSSSGERRESADAGGSQRPKLQLKPRTKPLPGEDGGDEGSEDAENADDAEEEDAQQDDEPAEMSADKAKTKIDTDMKELWGEKDAGGSRNPDDVVEYLRALPAEHQPLLAVRLLEDVFRISKVKDAEVVAKGWSQALSEGVTSKEVLLKGIEARMPTLDDDSIDFPQAYKAIAIVVRSISLEDEEIDALLEQVDVFGEPRITPKMKLDKALAQVDEDQ